MMKRLNIIGCGSVGKTLGRLWARKGVFDIGDILNRSEESSNKAVEFVGSGRPSSAIGTMSSADVFLIGTSDDHIIDCCRALAASRILRTGDVVFQCSGALPSADLAAVKELGARIASVHPVKSFADPNLSAATFEGTFCGVEGDEEALSVLRSAFEAIGGITFAVDPDYKTVYHSATVVVCNYLTALLEFGIQAYAKAGLNRETSMHVMEPIVRGTVDNIFKFGTVKALTGPIARGDYAVVARQLNALSTWNGRFGDLYRDLGSVALELSRLQGTASSNSLSALAELLDSRQGVHSFESNSIASNKTLTDGSPASRPPAEG